MLRPKATPDYERTLHTRRREDVRTIDQDDDVEIVDNELDWDDDDDVIERRRDPLRR